MTPQDLLSRSAKQVQQDLKEAKIKLWYTYGDTAVDLSDAEDKVALQHLLNRDVTSLAEMLWIIVNR
jgi:hypothetical protein